MEDLSKERQIVLERLAGVVGWREATTVVRPPGEPIVLYINQVDWERLVSEEGLRWPEFIGFLFFDGEGGVTHPLVYRHTGQVAQHYYRGYYHRNRVVVDYNSYRSPELTSLLRPVRFAVQPLSALQALSLEEQHGQLIEQVEQIVQAARRGNTDRSVRLAAGVAHRRPVELRPPLPKR